MVTSGGSLSITQTTMLKVRAWKPGPVASEITTGSYELKAVTPVVTPATGQYASAQTVTMSNDHVRGDDPLHDRRVGTVGDGHGLQRRDHVAPGSGAFTSTSLLTLATTTPGATVRYTIDGTDPSGASAAYVFPS